MYEKFIVKDAQTLQRIENGLRETYFKAYDQGFLKSSHGQEDIDANVFNRYNSALQHVVPWVAGQITLQGKVLVEIGCGTGSSTAAFSHFVKEIHGYDVDEPSVEGARSRLEILGIQNAELHVIEPEQLMHHLQENHGGGVDIILLYAVLEHQTIEERHATLKQCWQLLNEDGLLVVVETPNILLYFDHHTSQLPFMQMLPAELYSRYARFSSRDGFNTNFKKDESLSAKELEKKISRWGRGVSYHDFRLTLGENYAKYLVCSGFEKEMLAWFDVSPEEELLRLYFEANHLKIPLGFSRGVLSLIFKKNSQLQELVEKVPDNRFFFPVDTVWQQKCENEYLTAALSEKEHLLKEIVESRRWRYTNYVTQPYRNIKEWLSKNKAN